MVAMLLGCLAEVRSFAKKGSVMAQQESLEVYQLHIFLKGISPMIWRRLLVENNRSIADLHYAIQIAMGWSDSYLHQFDIWGKKYGISYAGGLSFSDNARKVLLKDFQFRGGEKFIYEYNFFDHWDHAIRLEKKLPLDSRKKYPSCVGGSCSAPPENCGGVMSFMELKDHYSIWRIEEELLEAIEQYEEENDRERVQETVENLQYWLTVHTFDRKKINDQLQRHFNAKEETQPNEEMKNED